MFLAVVFGLLLLGYLVAWVHPTTRPYAKRYWWLAVLVLTFVLGMVVAAPRRKAQDKAQVPTPDLGKIDAVYKAAVDGMTRADIELARRRLAAQLTDQASADRLHNFDAAVHAARREPDIERRRAAIAALVADARRQ